MDTETPIVKSAAGAEAPPPEDSPGYWYQLIDEEVAGGFLDLTTRAMQAKRQRGGGPRFIRLSSRSIKYRRVDLRAYSEAHLRTSTADDGGTE